DAEPVRLLAVLPVDVDRRPPDLDDVARAEEALLVDLLPVHERAVVGLEVEDRDLVAAPRELAVPPREVAVLDRDRVAGLAAERDVARERFAPLDRAADDDEFGRLGRAPGAAHVGDSCLQRANLAPGCRARTPGTRESCDPHTLRIQRPVRSRIESHGRTGRGPRGGFPSW